MLGVSNLWWVPLSNIFGRRIIILVSLLLLAVFSFWCAVAQSFNSLLAARVFQGIGGAAAETLAPDIVGRVFFVHQLGRAMVSQCTKVILSFYSFPIHHLQWLRIHEWYDEFEARQSSLIGLC